MPTAALTFSTDIQIFNATAEQVTKIETAAELIKQVVATEAFRDAVLNHTYNGRKTFVDNEGLSNEAIYEKILDGAEELNDVKDNTMDLEIETYYESGSTVGYTYPSSRRVWMNTRYLNSYTPAETTRNMIHEWLHKIGFTHAYYYSSSRDYSVPYAIGDIMEKIATRIANGAGDVPAQAPTALALASSNGKLTLSWTAATSPEGIVKYKVYRKLSGSSSTYLQGTTTTALSFTQDRPSRDAEYSVKAVDGDGEVLASTPVKFVRVVELTAPAGLAISVSGKKLTLSWEAATASEGLSKYKVYRKLSGSGSTYLQGSTTGLSFTQTTPSKNAVYYVKAVDNDGLTVKSAVVDFTK